MRPVIAFASARPKESVRAREKHIYRNGRWPMTGAEESNCKNCG